MLYQQIVSVKGQQNKTEIKQNIAYDELISKPREEDPFMILNRLAKAEISLEEYDKLKRVLE